MYSNGKIHKFIFYNKDGSINYNEIKKTIIMFARASIIEINSIVIAAAGETTSTHHVNM